MESRILPFEMSGRSHEKQEAKMVPVVAFVSFHDCKELKTVMIPWRGSNCGKCSFKTNYGYINTIHQVHYESTPPYMTGFCLAVAKRCRERVGGLAQHKMPSNLLDAGLAA